MRPVMNGHIFMQMIFVSRRPLPRSLCLQTKGKEGQFCFASLVVSFFPFGCRCQPQIRRHFCFPASTLYIFISPACRPLDCWCHVKMVSRGCANCVTF